MGNTPSKYSKVGRDVIKRMYAEGKIRGDISGIDNLDFDSLEFKSGDKWYNISEADMSHKHGKEAVTWWNDEGRYYGPKAPEVRAFMTNPDNYYLEHFSINRSEGGAIRDRYLPPEKGGN